MPGQPGSSALWPALASHHITLVCLDKQLRLRQGPNSLYLADEELSQVPKATKSEAASAQHLSRQEPWMQKGSFPNWNPQLKGTLRKTYLFPTSRKDALLSKTAEVEMDMAISIHA